MAWNGSNASAKSSERPASGGSIRPLTRNSSLKRCVLAGVLVVAAGGAAVWWFFGRGSVRLADEDTGSRRSQGSIAEVKTQITTNVIESEIVSHTESRTYRDEHGILRHPGGQRAYDPSRPKKVIHMNRDDDGNPLYRTSVFTRNRAEHEIERFLRIKPGDPLHGSRIYDERFEEDYRRSCEMPIVVSKDDPPDVAEMKRAMIQVKIDINDRIHAGEKVCDIMNETSKELRKLAAYKRDIQKMVLDETSDANLSEKDVQSYIDAANVLLESKGISGLKGTAILRRNLSLKNKENRR